MRRLRPFLSWLIVTALSLAVVATPLQATLASANPSAPQIDVLSPSSIPAGHASFPLSVYGSGFNSASKVIFGSTDLTTTYVSDYRLDAEVPAALVQTPGDVEVGVWDGTATGGASPVTFRVTSDTATNAAIDTVTPNSAPAGQTAPVHIRITGNSFQTGATVNANSNPIPTTYESANAIQADIPVTYLATSGFLNITVVNPGAAPSNALQFIVSERSSPAPTIASLRPASATVGSGDLTLTVDGTNFTAGSVVVFEHAELTTTVVSSTELRATVPAARLTTARTVPVLVSNNDTQVSSQSVNFTIAAAPLPAPTISSLSPSGTVSGRSDVVLTVTGSNFVSGSVVRFDGTALSTTFVSATQLRATIPASKIAQPGNAAVTVDNGANGGASSAVSFPIERSYPPSTARVSLSSDNRQAGRGVRAGSISADGRYVVFKTDAALVADDTNGVDDIYLRDRATNRTTRISLKSSGQQTKISSYGPVISADGQYVAFAAYGSLIDDKPSTWSQIHVYERATGRLSLASMRADGVIGDRNSSWPSISNDGRFVAFTSESTNLVAGVSVPPSQGWISHAYLWDRTTGQVSLVSSSAAGTPASRWASQAVVSGDGRFVSFVSLAENLVPGDTNLQLGGSAEDGTRYMTGTDVFVKERQTGAIERVSVSSSNAQGRPVTVRGIPAGGANEARISDDGRYVVFKATYPNLVDGLPESFAANGGVFLRDRVAGTTTLVSRGWSGAPLDEAPMEPRVSANGRYIAYWSRATNALILPTSENGKAHAFLYDRDTGATSLIVHTAAGAESTAEATVEWMSADARYLLFATPSAEIVPSDTNGVHDLFVYDRTGGTRSWTPPADPGPAGAIFQPDRSACDSTECPLYASAECGGFGAASLGARIQALQVPTFSLGTFYQVRDRVLVGTPEGTRLTQVYYQTGPEIVRLMVANPSLATEVASTAQALQPQLDALVNGRGDTATITAEQVQQVNRVLDHIEQLASPELKMTIQSERAVHPIETYVGRSVAQVADAVTQSPPKTRIYVGIVQRVSNSW